MAKELLNRPNVVPVLEQMRRKGMPERVRTHPLRDVGLPCRLSDGSLNDGLVEVKAD